MIEKYSRKNSAHMLSKNFSVGEFACHDGSDLILIDTELVKLLQRIRDHFGAAVSINSAYRNAVYNKKIGGVANSQHTKGTAADITVKGIEPRQIAEYAEFLMPQSGGIGLYSGFTHVDVRPNRARWQNFGREVAVGGFSGYTEKKTSEEAGEKITTVSAAISHLVKKGVINTPDIWYGGTWSDGDFKHLLIKCAERTVGSKVGSAAAAGGVLHSEGIINTPEIWYRGEWTDADFRHLIIKAANHI